MSNIASTIDQLGQIKAQISTLKELEKKLSQAVQSFGEGAYDGNLFRAAVSEVAASASLDPKAAEAKLRELGVDGRWFSKNLKVREAYVTVRVTARKTS